MTPPFVYWGCGCFLAFSEVLHALIYMAPLWGRPITIIMPQMKERDSVCVSRDTPSRGVRIPAVTCCAELPSFWRGVKFCKRSQGGRKGLVINGLGAKQKIREKRARTTETMCYVNSWTEEMIITRGNLVRLLWRGETWDGCWKIGRTEGGRKYSRCWNIRVNASRGGNDLAYLQSKPARPG